MKIKKNIYTLLFLVITSVSYTQQFIESPYQTDSLYAKLKIRTIKENVSMTYGTADISYFKITTFNKLGQPLLSKKVNYRTNVPVTKIGEYSYNDKRCIKFNSFENGNIDRYTVYSYDAVSGKLSKEERFDSKQQKVSETNYLFNSTVVEKTDFLSNQLFKKTIKTYEPNWLEREVTHVQFRNGVESDRFSIMSKYEWQKNETVLVEFKTGKKFYVKNKYYFDTNKLLLEKEFFDKSIKQKYEYFYEKDIKEKLIKKVFLDEIGKKIDSLKASRKFYYYTTNQIFNNGYILAKNIEGKLLSKVECFDMDYLILDGKCIMYYPNGKLKLEAFFKMNQLQGELKGYDENGILIRLEIYDAGKLTSGKCLDASGKEVEFTLFEVNKAELGVEN
ncbi:toxin-antitoxin system YwqK family antitoxin [Flavobacterium sp. GCM10027622]|uniref:toxin-antitoxin system YwqK family antitoxin n=1 Tax=unclassified Flavobacterium TaxID=196869 RepID=UPI00361509F1